MAHRVGVDLAAPESEHARWSVYLKAMGSSELWGLLLKAIGSEPDVAVASSVVLRMLERVSPNERNLWVDRLPQGKNRDFASRRASEIQIFEELSSGSNISQGAARSSFSPAWSAWLQLRLAAASSDTALLRLLSEHGATKRVRAAARDRLRVFGVAP